MSQHTIKEPAQNKIALELADHSLPDAERALILRTLSETGWNLKRSAALLHIARGTLYSKMDKYQIKKPL
ncbi:MAG: helix-turn-helix domain-containing protein [Desulfobacterales bacterium]|nr:helix-turn-helix domain-containing protein [Desulfobacterales bacterium]